MNMLTPIKRDMENGVCVLTGMALGAGLAYILDPDRGRRRRALLRDEATRMLHDTGKIVDSGLRDLNNRVTGKMVEVASVFMPATVSDEVLRSRIRTMLGRCVSHAHAIDVNVADGAVTLSGHILEADVPRLLSALRHMRSIRSITDRLLVHAEPGNVPDLQGTPRIFRDNALLEPKLTPATRLGVAAAGSFLAAYGIAKRGIFGLGFGLAGIGIFTRALKLEPSHNFSAANALERGIDFQKTITIDAPLERVFRMLTTPENFPRVLSHVENIKQIGDNVYRWTVAGPLGTIASWDAEITRVIDNELLEWRTLPGSMIDHAGIVRVDPTPYGETRVHLRVSYKPPLGALGITLAEFFSLFPKHMLDDDLARFKSLMEQGKTTVHHEKITLEEISVGH